MKKVYFTIVLILMANWSLDAQTYYIYGTTDISLGNKALLHTNELKIGNSTSASERAKNLLRFGDGTYIQLGEWEADDFLSFKATKYNFTYGNVGIGTTNPQYKLDVAGNTRIVGELYLSGSSGGLISTTNAAPITFDVDGVLAGNTGNLENSNVSFGWQALFQNTGSSNTAIGTSVLLSNTTGSSNTAMGESALFQNTGSSNTAMGKSALYSNTTGGNNTAIGISTLRLNTTGYNNTAIGASALYSNTTGSNNTAIGASALNRNTTGGINTAIGISTLYRNTTGYYNIAIGSWTFQNNTTGYKNTVVGNVAGASNVTGSNNTLVGFAAEVGTGNLNNATAIGYEAIATSSNQARIGSNLVSSIGGYANWSNISDGRAKKNIRTDVPGLDFIKLLQPVTFNLDLDIVDELLKIDKTKKPNKEELSPEAIEIDKKSREAKEKVVQTGFIAQDVEKVAQSIGYDFSGVDVDETGIYGLRYAEFVVPLVKAAQELSERNDSLQAQVSDLTKQVNDLTKLVHSLLENEAASASLKSENVVELTTGLQELTNSGVSLQQNSPNPFNQSTVIRYTLPKTDKQAQIAISNIAGQIIKQIPLRLGTDSITIERGAFPAGIYYYSLYVGNSLIDTKKMILTN